MITKSTLRHVRASRVGMLLNMPRRFFGAVRLAGGPLLRTVPWVVKSKEDTNFTYDITDQSISYLAHAISIVTGVSAVEALNYMREAQGDSVLKSHVIRGLQTGDCKYYSDARCDFGRRLGWYALARILKPGTVVETGVDKGLGSVLLCSALLRNGSGRYYGTDINPNAGSLLSGVYASVGEILYGDSIASLRHLKVPINLFINDSHHSAEYEREEYDVVMNKLTGESVVVSDNAHSCSSLMAWSESKGRKFLFWKEEPKDHWYSGAGIGFSFR